MSECNFISMGNPIVTDEEGNKYIRTYDQGVGADILEPLNFPKNQLAKPKRKSRISYIPKNR